MKKFFISISIAALCFGSLISFSGCDGLFAKKVGSLSELLSCGNRSVVLTDDIDCNFETIKTLQCSSFDGRGHTIKNFVLTASGATNDAALFGALTSSIKNVTIDNATLSGENVLSLAVIKIGGGGTIENVHVTNSKLTATQSNYFDCYVGGIYAGAYDARISGSFVGNLGRSKISADAIIKNCSVENVEINITGYKNFSGTCYDIYGGGVAAACDTISDCYAKDCEISLEAQNNYSSVCAGGIVAYTAGDVINSYAVGNTIEASNPYYSGGTFSYYSTSTVHAGGIIGRAECNEKNNTTNYKKLQYCYAQENQIHVESTGSLYAGGMAGRVSGYQVQQCYAISNTMTGDKCLGGNENAVYRNYGGLLGLAENASSLASCFSHDNAMTEKSPSPKAGSSRAGGLAILADSVSANYCGTYQNQFDVPESDEFCPRTASGIYNCFITCEDNGNINSCEVVAEDFWFSEDSMKNKLKLGGSSWKFESDKLPYLSFASQNQD